MITLFSLCARIQMCVCVSAEGKKPCNVSKLIMLKLTSKFDFSDGWPGWPSG